MAHIVMVYMVMGQMVMDLRTRLSVSAPSRFRSVEIVPPGIYLCTNVVMAYIVMVHIIMAYISMACMFRSVEIVPPGIFLCIHTVMADVFMA